MLRKARRIADMTQVELGDKVNMRHTDISRLETGRDIAVRGNAVKIATALGVTVDEIFIEDPGKPGWYRRRPARVRGKGKKVTK